MVHATSNGYKAHATGLLKEAKVQAHPPNQNSNDGKRDGLNAANSPDFRMRRSMEEITLACAVAENPQNRILYVWQRGT